MSNIDLWALAAYGGVALVLAGAMLILSHVLGQRHRQDATGEPYESGVASTGSAELRFSARFYIVAMLFVVFDLEAVFLFAWSLVVKEAGWTGFWGASVFVLILLVGLLYEWREGTFDFGPRPRAQRKAVGWSEARAGLRSQEERESALTVR
jgi:NADH-quinone oxidoreductase subunit A